MYRYTETMLNIQKMVLGLRAQNMLLVDLVALRMRPLETFLWQGMIVSGILGVEITFSSDYSAQQLKNECAHATRAMFKANDVNKTGSYGY